MKTYSKPYSLFLSPYDLERLADFECPLELPERERERDRE